MSTKARQVLPLPHRMFNSSATFQKSDGKTNVWLFLSISPLAQIQTDSWATEIIFSHGSHWDPGRMFLSVRMCLKIPIIGSKYKKKMQMAVHWLNEIKVEKTQNPIEKQVDFKGCSRC